MADKLRRYADLPLDDQPLKGAWVILPDHEIAYRFEGREEEIRFKGPIVAAEPEALVVALTVRQEDQTVTTRTVKITGRWRTDGQNRLVFEAQKSGHGPADVLTFKGTWKLNDAHEIVYSYRSENQKKSRKAEQELVFRGAWQIADKRHLTYVLSVDADSAFRFRGAFQTPSILAKTGEIRFQLGAEARGRRGAKRTITLFGTWKVGRDLSLSFELDQPAGPRRVLRFGGEFQAGRVGRVTVNLLSEDGAPLGVELILTKEFWRGDGELFARLVRTAQESAVEAGGRIRF